MPSAAHRSADRIDSMASTRPARPARFDLVSLVRLVRFICPNHPPSRFAAALVSTLLGLGAMACSAGGPSEAAASGPPGAEAGGPPGAAAARTVLSPATDTVFIEWRRPAATVPGGGSPAVPTAVPGRPAASRGPRETSPWERVSIGLGGLWVGPDNREDGPRVHYLFARRQRSDDLAQLARAFAPFRLPGGSAGREQDGEVRAPQMGSTEALSQGADTSYGSLAFRGRGAAEASPADRRMIAEWTRAVAVEAAGESGSSTPYGLAFTWHRGAVAGGVCDDLAVYLSGEVSAGSCGAGAEIGGRLAGERLQRLYGWVDGLAAFQDAGEQGVRADALLERLIFVGRGGRAASREDVAAIEAFAGALHRELTVTGGAAGEATAAPQRPSAAVARRASLPVSEPSPPARKRPADSPQSANPSPRPAPAGHQPGEAEEPPGPPPPHRVSERALLRAGTLLGKPGYLASKPRKPREMRAATSASTRGNARPPGQARYRGSQTGSNFSLY
jgi:hypothetical protein